MRVIMVLVALAASLSVGACKLQTGGVTNGADMTGQKPDAPKQDTTKP